MTHAWHARSTEDVLTAVVSDATGGLGADEARRRLSTGGPNVLRTGRKVSGLDILAAQFRSVVVWVLIGAAAVAIAVGEPIDATAILAIVVANALIGFLQEYRAERAVAALARLTTPQARVVRGGHAVVVPAAEVVRGDVLLLEGGDLVSADARLLETTALRTIEAVLTGESEARRQGRRPVCGRCTHRRAAEHGLPRDQCRERRRACRRRGDGHGDRVRAHRHASRDRLSRRHTRSSRSSTSWAAAFLWLASRSWPSSSASACCAGSRRSSFS